MIKITPGGIFFLVGGASSHRISLAPLLMHNWQMIFHCAQTQRRASPTAPWSALPKKPTSKVKSLLSVFFVLKRLLHTSFIIWQLCNEVFNFLKDSSKKLGPVCCCVSYSDLVRGRGDGNWNVEVHVDILILEKVSFFFFTAFCNNLMKKRRRRFERSVKWSCSLQ